MLCPYKGFCYMFLYGEVGKYSRKAYLPLSLFQLFFLQSVVFASQFSGIVVDVKGQPISNAVVRLQGTSFLTLTDQKGHFNIVIDEVISSKYITAWKSGFYNGGQPVSRENKEYRIILISIPLSDNQKYKWLPPSHDQMPRPIDSTVEVKPCQVCHPVLTEQWRNSAHAGSAINPLFLAFFNGTDAYGGKGIGLGYKLDFPNSNGNCTTCHVPALALDNPFSADPNEAQGVVKEGIFCDICHKINGVNIDQTGGYPGILSIKLQRPADGHQTFYGPYDDVFPGDDSYHPLYKNSQYCAPCHNGKFWNVLTYSEFQEWAESSYAKENIHCQDCHMKPDGKMTRFALEKEGGVLRDPVTIPSHLFFGVRDRVFMMEAIDLITQANLAGDTLKVCVTVKNVKAGHHYPTGNPMRNMLLLVDVVDGDGSSLLMNKGERVPVWGGVGTVEEGNYAGLPGKGFAKVLKDLLPYPDGRRKRHFQNENPAPHWRPTLVESDDRIPANQSDVSNYQFHVPKTLSRSLHITTRLLYRRVYKNLLDAKGLKIPDIEIARKNLIIKR